MSFWPTLSVIEVFERLILFILGAVVVVVVVEVEVALVVVVVVVVDAAVDFVVVVVVVEAEVAAVVVAVVTAAVVVSAFLLRSRNPAKSRGPPAELYA